MREISCRYICSDRCMGADVSSAIWTQTYEIDQKYKTDYHQRFVEWVKYVEKNDLQVHSAVTDARGDRSKRPGRQINPDMYVHVVAKKNEGVVIRGAKASIISVPYSNEVLVVPTRNLHEDEKDFAIACALPVDTKGITYICRPPLLFRGRKDYLNIP